MMNMTDRATAADMRGISNTANVKAAEKEMLNISVAVYKAAKKGLTYINYRMSWRISSGARVELKAALAELGYELGNTTTNKWYIAW